MSETNKATALKFIEAMSNGDPDTAATTITRDAVCTSMGFGKLSGTRGYDGIVGNMGAFKQLIPTGLRPKIKSVTAEGNRVAVEFDGDAVLANGVDYCNQYCMTFVFEGELIKSINEYYCTILADERIGPLLGPVEAQRNAKSA
jgi:ketosteroid isomerase-like protein